MSASNRVLYSSSGSVVGYRLYAIHKYIAYIQDGPFKFGMAWPTGGLFLIFI